jgi:hypothetical protein
MKSCKFQYMCDTSERMLGGRARTGSLLRFYKIMAVPTSECWTPTKQEDSQTETAEMRFLRTAAG